ncbi:TetR/AcrR family transcriptional regulator [Williamsia maris]|uniref:Transcriptional regulator, TetR family n=1 Tax=Williamsia maris TaxID=72806 RepID=A0ABT1HKB9_9NOCA|nr:TetR/AcrR family transcriptional regulator [Williamsia maris]MCP2178334.1 transcriptional regulator, TetR family [Williamsia maris]
MTASEAFAVPQEQSEPARRTGRLSVDDWVRAALDLLVRDGVAAVRITRLCEELHVTKGSFYWHFTDINGLMEAVADHWCDTQNTSMGALVDLGSMAPRDRLETMTAALVGDRSWAVENAIREWARSNVIVADTVRRLDRLVFSVVQEALLELGFDHAEARLRAGALVYAGIGFLHARDSLDTPTADEIRSIFWVITARPDA